MAFADLLDDETLYVNTAWQERELIAQVPGLNWNDKLRAWVGPVSWAACVVLRGVFGVGLHVGERLNDWARRERDVRVDPTMNLRDLEDWPKEWAHGAVYQRADRRLHGFQEVGAYFGLVAGDCLISDAMGLGKTVTTIAILASAGLRSVALPALVICPNSVKSVWKRHVLEWLPGVTPYVVGGGAVDRRKVLDAAKADPTAVVIINIEAVRLLSRSAPYGSVRLKRCRECDKAHGDPDLPMTRCEVHPKPLNGFGFKTVVLDEAHKIKNPESIQTRACWAVMHDPSVERRIALTGTPIANHVGDLWSIMHGVARRDFPVKGRFTDRFALTSWGRNGGLEIVGVHPERRDEFFRILDPRFRRMTKDRVLDQLPPKVYSTRFVELSPKAMKAYREIEKGNLTVLDDGQLLVAANNLVGRTRLIQFASSYAELVSDPRPNDPDHMRVLLSEPSPKVDALVEIIEDIGDKPFVAVAESRQLVQLAANRLAKVGIKHALLVGGMTDDERAAVIQRLRDGYVRVLLFTAQAGGTGVDGMQCVDTLVRLQRSWSMVTNVQVEDRVHRIGSETHDSVNIIDVVAEGTVEQTIQLPRLEEKLLRLLEITRDRAELRRAVDIDGTAVVLRARLDNEERRILGSDLGLEDTENR